MGKAIVYREPYIKGGYQMSNGSKEASRINPRHIRELTCEEIKKVLDRNAYLNLAVCNCDGAHVFPMSYRYKNECCVCKFTMRTGICNDAAHIIQHNNNKVVLSLNRNTCNGVLNVTVRGTAELQTIEADGEGCCGKKRDEVVIVVTATEVTGRKYYFHGC